ncbi:hypothetical protein [Phytomonospora endophytica]|uniref:Uncharacterized protein n=1 Tax=Phytomonospora endophytica TaxID=714109 RepID=A0A841FN82_9ACTN|nr:hypothetical protein [Phytomonospora endophytica]MBB6035258.1 hypothetical protein [Phytomonospora endophytica]GIG63993.1 hypothetical protein Pen01_02880 [Phytomonospora endophytica]
MARQTHKDLIRAHVIGDMTAGDAISEQIPGEEQLELFGYTTAFFILMLQQRFGETASREAITEFVEEMKYDYRSAEPPIRPLLIEGAIRGVFGEEGLLEDIATGELVKVYYQVIAKIAVQDPDVIPKLDEYLDAAGQLADTWAEED